MHVGMTGLVSVLVATGVLACGTAHPAEGAGRTPGRTHEPLAQVPADGVPADGVRIDRAQIDRAALERLVDSVLAVRMGAEHAPGAVFVLVQDGQAVLAKGYGVADLDTRRPVSPDSTIWRIGSITKVFTALAVMQLADRGQIGLHRDVNVYLRRLQVPRTFREPVTAAHLLTHTGGFDETPGVRLAPSRDALRPLDAFLREHLVRVRPPGRVTSYSSFGMALAGLLVEDVSGLTYEEYLQRHIFAPLEMSRTHVTPPAHLQSSLATGYEYAGGAHTRAPYEWYHTTPAGAINATAMDMARLLIALLARPAAADGARLLSADALARMQRRQATMHPLIAGWGYGLQENRTNGQRIFEHGGDIAGFSALLVLLPDHRTGFFIANHHEGSNLRFALEQAILDRFFPDRRGLVPPPLPSGTRARAERVAGTYRWNIYCRRCTSAQQLPEYRVMANEDGSITLTGKRWVEVRPLYFRSVDGKEELGFAEDSTGRVMHLTGGSWKVMERVR
jgi:CubicO group peptidase (beta-lactamase class C family)